MEKDSFDSSGRALLVADTDETQAYVFESNKLPEIRGASRQLEELNQKIGGLIQEQHEGAVIFAGGGSLLALVDVDKSQSAITDVEQLYPATTGVATISAIARPLPPDYEKQFGEYVTWAGHWLRQHKESKEAPPFFEVLPHQTRCMSCQKRPADARASASVPEPDYAICTVCYAKRREGTFEQRGFWFGQFQDALQANEGWLTHYRSRGLRDVSLPYSVQEIAEASQTPDKLVAFVYLDGNRIGRLLQRIPTSESYKKISKGLREVTRHAVFKALATCLHPVTVTGSDLRPVAERGQPVVIHPFEIITIGGDDILLLVPAHAAIPIAVNIGQDFERDMTGIARQHLPNSEVISMSAGVVIADDHTPVRLMADVARQLLKEAKKLKDGALDFHVLHSSESLHKTITAWRASYPYLIEGGGRSGANLRLLGRPYGYDKMHQLWRAIENMKRQNFSNSQLNLLAESLLEGRASSTLFYQYQRKRGDENAYAALERALGQVQRTEEKDPLPWQTVTGEHYSHQTSLWDIAELFGFVPKPNTEARYA